jgi:hypothetical protein
LALAPKSATAETYSLNFQTGSAPNYLQALSTLTSAMIVDTGTCTTSVVLYQDSGSGYVLQTDNTEALIVGTSVKVATKTVKSYNFKLVVTSTSTMTSGSADYFFIVNVACSLTLTPASSVVTTFNKF